MNVTKGYELWLLKAVEDKDLGVELKSIAGDEKAIHERFYTDLKFGTAGLRGILGAGCNRMNIYTVRKATQGLAAYIKRQEGELSAAIAYDSRNKSELFSREAASVLAGNGIKTYLYDRLMPTPMLSWAVRELHCTAGIVVTASHNPAEYNGYKVYGRDGCQLTSEASDSVFNEIENVDPFCGVTMIPFEKGLAEKSIQYIPKDISEAFEQRIMQCTLRPEMLPQSDLSVVYTPLCGAGNIPVRGVLKRAGLKNLAVVPQQELPDGNFPTCPYPNPEAAEAVSLGIKLAEKLGADILLATDPDADRVGVAVRHKGEYLRLTGNETGVLLTDYIALTLKEQGKLPRNPVMIKSIVSTPLTDLVAAHYGVEVLNVLTGFKYIGERIAGLEEAGELGRLIFSYEESCGYLPGAYVRDKDAVGTCLVTAEMAAWHKSQGRTLVDALEEISKRHGNFCERVTNTAFAGSDGMAKMAELMNWLFANPPARLGEYDIPCYRNLREQKQVEGEKITPIDLPASDVLVLLMPKDITVIIRPSGTEPKLKVYYLCKGKTPKLAADICDELQKAVEELLKI